MILRNFNRVFLLKSLNLENLLQQRRQKITYRSGAFKPMPTSAPYGLVGLVCTVVPGLLIGAAISKNMASFLEENELFVPSDEDDDD
uniref:Essential MCU regulator, mitochondrial n=1 Tax=Culicoides sonorensis TaxID=179676 RepID=A0A336MPI5_CULSO